jgi:hypothetical protein
MYNTSTDKALAVATIFLPALFTATLAVLARRSMRQTIRALGLAGLIALLISFAVYDRATTIGSLRSLSSGAGGYRAILVSNLFLALARWLLIAALAFALWDAASRRRGWWAAGLGATLILGVALFAEFSGLPVLDLFGGLFAFALNVRFHTVGQERVFFLVVELLLALAYLPGLFYASRASGPATEEALAPTIVDR